MKFLNTIIILTVASFFFNSKIQAQSNSEIAQNWASYSQAIDVSDKEGYDFRVSVAIRIENGRKNSKGALWVRVDKKEGGFGFFKNNVYETDATDKWQVFEIKGTIDNGASLLNLGAFCQNSGDFYFDDFKMEIKKGNGKWQTITLSNPGFEEDKAKGDLWTNGVSKNKIVAVKNFNAGYSANQPYKGKGCLYIKSRNIMGSTDNGKFIDVNGVSLYYEIYGEGEPLLLLHGNGGSIGNFINQLDEFSKKYKVILVDCRGRGNSTYQKEVELTFDLQIEDLALFLDKLNVSKTHIVGWSDGGILGLLMAIKHPEKVDKLVSMAGNIFPEGCVDLDDMKKTRDNLIKENKDHKNDLIIDLYNLDIKYPNLAYKDLSAITSKTLIMAGDHDEIKNEHTVKMYEAIPGAQLAILPNSTHYMPIQNPKLFNQIVLDFLN